jgi:hypothetical protein
MTRPPCDVPGCGRPHYGQGYCRAHHARWRRHGDPDVESPIAAPAAGYVVLSVSGAHRRVRATRGTPAGQRCAGCGGEATVWRYDGADPAERVDPHGRRYSLDPAHYRPCCRFCLRRAGADRHALLPTSRRRPAFDVERVARLYAAGATSRGLAALMRVSPGTVLRALRAHGVAIRPPVAVTRRSRRHHVTADPSTTSRTPNDHRTHATNRSSSSFTNDSAIHSRQPSRHTTTTTSSQRRDQNEGQHNDPRAQSGPTHQRSLGVGRVPCGPAVTEPQDPREAE